jgi:hypothetical protein
VLPDAWLNAEHQLQPVMPMNTLSRRAECVVRAWELRSAASAVLEVASTAFPPASDACAAPAACTAASSAAFTACSGQLWLSSQLQVNEQD